MVRPWFAPECLDLAAMVLCFQSSHLRRSRWPCRNSPSRFDQCLSNQSYQLVSSQCPVHCLCPMFLCGYHHDSLRGPAPSDQVAQTHLCRRRQNTRLSGLEPEFDRCGYLVDVLTAGAGSTAKRLLDFIVGENQVIFDSDHGSTSRFVAPVLMASWPFAVRVVFKCFSVPGHPPPRYCGMPKQV